MAHAQAYAGKDLVINGKKFFLGLFKNPDQDEPESYFAALLLETGNDTWKNLLQLPPMPIANPTKGAAATMNDILNLVNAKVVESAPPIGGSPVETDTWIQRLKKLFDGVLVVDGKIVVG